MLRGRKALALPAALVWLCVTLNACSGAEPAQASDEEALDIAFTPSGGTFLSALSVSISVKNSAAEVHFTLDGTLPSAGSPVYERPIELEGSARLRAVAIVPMKSGESQVSTGGAGGRTGAAGAAGTTGSSPLRQGPIAGETYVRVLPDAAQFTSHLPIVVLNTFEVGALNPQGEDFVPATLHVLEPKALGTSLVGSATLDTRIGIHVRGESSRDFPKKQYAVELWQEDRNEDVDLSFLGMPAGSDWVFSDAVRMDRSLIRNALVYEMSNRIGRYAPRTRFVEVFLVERGGDLRSDSFLGLYTVIEKIKRGPDRVSVAKLDQNDLVEPAVTGGFILRIDKGPSDFQAAGRGMQFAYPDSELMKLPDRRPQTDFIRGYIDRFAQAAAAPDFKHPTTLEPYSKFIDVDAFIDHHVINALAKNPDALRISAYFHKDRQGLLAAGPVWDFDRTLGTPYDDRAKEPEEWKRPGSDGTDLFQEGFWRDLFRDPAFKARYRERFLSLLEGEFSADKLDRIIDHLALSVGAAAPRNFKRWPDSPPRDGTHAAELALLKDFLRRRVNWLKIQLNTGF